MEDVREKHKNEMRNRNIRMSSDTRKMLMKISNDLANIEDRKISMGEVVDRILKGPDIYERLIRGSYDRRKI